MNLATERRIAPFKPKVIYASATMPRRSCLRAAFSRLLLALVLVAAGSHWALLAQQRPAPAQTPAIETIQIRPNVYVIFGAGANIVAHVGEDGVILVDSGSTPTAEKVVEAV